MITEKIVMRNQSGEQYTINRSIGMESPEYIEAVKQNNGYALPLEDKRCYQESCEACHSYDCERFYDKDYGEYAFACQLSNEAYLRAKEETNNEE